MTLAYAALTGYTWQQFTGRTWADLLPGAAFLPGQIGASARYLVEFAWGANLSANPSTWIWYDETARLREGSGKGITITAVGRVDETSQSPSVNCSFELDNTSGDYGKGPASRRYPFVRPNTPVRVSVNVGTGLRGRFDGELIGATPSWDGTGNLAIVTVRASGSLRRVGQGHSPLRSAMYRAFSRSGAVAYWSLEDGANSGQAESGLLGGTSLSLGLGTVKFANTPGPAGSAPLADFSSGGTMSGAVAAGASATSWRIEFVTKFNAIPAVGFAAVLQWLTAGSVAVWEIDAQQLVDGGLSLQYIAANGAIGGPFISNVKVDDGLWHHIRVDASQSGPNIFLDVKLDGTSVISGPLASLTMGQISNVTINPTGDPTSEIPSLGHLIVWEPFASSVDTLTASRGYAGELATDRLVRLCAEEGIPLTVVGTSTFRMGPQGVDTFVNLVRECETADGGILHDGSARGLTYVAKSSLYNQSPTLTLDTTASEVGLPFTPVDDDQRYRNLYKVTRKGGGSATFSDTNGPLGTDAIETYDSTQNVSFVGDSRLFSRAAWLVHLGTVDEPYRYPTLTLDLAAAPARAADWLATRPGSRVDVLHVADVMRQHPPGTVSLLAQGWSSERISKFGWKAVINCTPYAPWRVFKVGTSRVETGGSTVHQAYAAGALSILVDSPGILWTTTAQYPTDFPFDVEIGGWQVTVTAISGTTSPQTFTVNALPAAIASGAPVSLWQPDAIAE